MDAEAVDLLAERLRTALQIEMHLTLAFEHASAPSTSSKRADETAAPCG